MCTLYCILLLIVWEVHTHPHTQIVSHITNGDICRFRCVFIIIIIQLLTHIDSTERWRKRKEKWCGVNCYFNIVYLKYIQIHIILSRFVYYYFCSDKICKSYFRLKIHYTKIGCCCRCCCRYSDLYMNHFLLRIRTSSSLHHNYVCSVYVHTE